LGYTTDRYEVESPFLIVPVMQINSLMVDT